MGMRARKRKSSRKENELKLKMEEESKVPHAKPVCGHPGLVMKAQAPALN
jgi:hypothetical protein